VTRYSHAALLLALAQSVSGQPGIGQNGVVNAASQIPPTLAGGAIAWGALFDIHGVRFGSQGHTQLTVSRNGVTTPIPILSAQPRRIEARMPRSAPLGSGSLVVTVDGQASKPFPIEVAASNPGIFSRNLEGWGPGRAENIDARGVRSANSRLNPARPGQRVALATTGMGSAKQVSVMVGNRLASAAPTTRGARDGEDEIVFRSPADAPRGCWVPTYVEITPKRASNVVTMSIASGSETCDTGPVPVVAGQRLAIVVLSRTIIKAERANVPDSITDDARILIQAESDEPNLPPMRLVPPPGTCTAYTSSYQAQTALSNPITSIVAPEARGLDAGTSITISRGAQTRTIGPSAPGHYRQRLGVGGFAARRGMPGPFLDPNDFVLASTGGQDVGPFTVHFTVADPFEWTNREALSVFDRSQGVTLRWKSPSKDDLMVIVARNVDDITTAIGMCLCTVRAASGQFSIPPAILANVPASRNVAVATIDELALGSLPAKPSAVIRGPGLNTGLVLMIYVNSRNTEYR
jgi:uncharacterized protein (TIGR03437 family)